MLRRFRELRRIVTDDGIEVSPSADPARERGDTRGGVCVGAGSLDLADWTRSSSLCILPMSPRICCNEPEFGRPGGRSAAAMPFLECAWPPVAAPLAPPALLRLSREMLLRDATDGVDRPLALYASEVAREWVYRWVVFEACRDRVFWCGSGTEARWRGKPGVAVIDLRMLAEASEIGGDGGVAVPETMTG